MPLVPTFLECLGDHILGSVGSNLHLIWLPPPHYSHIGYLHLTTVTFVTFTSQQSLHLTTVTLVTSTSLQSHWLPPPHYSYIGYLHLTTVTLVTSTSLQSHWLPPPLCYVGELFALVSGNDMNPILMAVYMFVKVN